MGKEKHVGLENQPGRDAFSFNIRGTTFLVSVLPFSSKTLLCVCLLREEVLLIVPQGLVSGLAYYVIGWASKERGPVFVSAFNPLSMVLVAILSTFIFMEKMYLGR